MRKYAGRELGFVGQPQARDPECSTVHEIRKAIHG